MPYREQAAEPTAPILGIEADPDGVLSYDEIARLPPSKLIEMITLRMMAALPGTHGYNRHPIHINGERAAQEFDRRIPRSMI